MSLVCVLHSGPTTSGRGTVNVSYRVNHENAVAFQASSSTEEKRSVEQAGTVTTLGKIVAKARTRSDVPSPINLRVALGKVKDVLVSN